MDVILHGCTLCGHRYDPRVGDVDRGIPAGTQFDDLPEGWVCPRCGAARDEFTPIPPLPAR